jgi:tight adherence protein B
MALLILVALTAGGFAFTTTLWATGYAGSSSAAATQRLSRLRSADADSKSDTPMFSLRRRGSVSLGGINLVSSNIVAQWAVDLERAGLTLNVREYFILRIVVAMVIAALTMLVLPFLPAALGAGAVGYLAVGFWLRRRISSRIHKLEAQLVELLSMVASGLRAGFGLIQALESSAEQLPSPLSVEIRRTLRDIAMGASIEQALGSLNDRAGSSDFDIVITAILIQRTVGGNLAEILDNVAHTMRERERIRGEIRTLTSQQRMTGYVIGGIPVGVGLAFSVINPSFMSLLFTDSLGRMMLGGAIALEVVGFFVISRIVNIEV